MTDLRYLTASELVYLNRRLCEQRKQDFGLVGLEDLREALTRPQLCIDGYEPFPDIWQKAGVLVDSLNKAQPFISANALTGFFAADLFLRLNGYSLASQAADIEQLQSVALQQETIPQIADWLKQRVEAANQETEDSL